MLFDVGWYLSLQLVAAAIVVLGSVAAYFATQRHNIEKEYNRQRELLKIRRKQALSELEQRVAEEQSNPKRDAILSKSFAELSADLREGRLSAKEVLRVFQQKTLEVHGRTNCLTGVVKEAEELAEQLDQKSGKRGALHGLPISVKESVPMKGYPCTCGVMAMAGLEVPVDPVILRLLKKEGAVPFVRTGIPQLCMSLECSNPIYGQVTNPHDSSRSPGGSSGGEGAVIGGGGSMLGIGSDIGGSIRFPALLNGIYGFKPGTSRVSDICAYYPWGQTVVLPVMGPMARDMEGLVALMRCMLVPDMYELDPSLPPLPFNDDVFLSKNTLKIGYFVHDGCYPVVPAMERAVEMAKQALEKAGHTLVPWQPPLPMGKNPTTFFFKAIQGDGGRDFLAYLQGDIVDECVSYMKYLLKMTRLRRWLQSMYLRLSGTPQLADFMQSFNGAGSISNWWDLTTTVEAYRREYSQSWKEAQLDAIICPSGVNPASKLGSSDKLMRLGSYMFVFNVLDIPAGVVPVGRVTPDDIRKLSSYEAGDDLTEWVIKDQEGTEGLPVGVQVATLRWQEETCLRVMKDIERIVDFSM